MNLCFICGLKILQNNERYKYYIAKSTMKVNEMHKMTILYFLKYQ